MRKPYISTRVELDEITLPRNSKLRFELLSVIGSPFAVGIEWDGNTLLVRGDIRYVPAVRVENFPARNIETDHQDGAK